MEGQALRRAVNVAESAMEREGGGRSLVGLGREGWHGWMDGDGKGGVQKETDGLRSCDLRDSGKHGHGCRRLESELGRHGPRPSRRGNLGCGAGRLGLR